MSYYFDGKMYALSAGQFGHKNIELQFWDVEFDMSTRKGFVVEKCNTMNYTLSKCIRNEGLEE